MTEYAPAKMSDISEFSKLCMLQNKKSIQRIIIAPIRCEKMVGYLTLNICFSKQIVFLVLENCLLLGADNIADKYQACFHAKWRLLFIRTHATLYCSIFLMFCSTFFRQAFYCPLLSMELRINTSSIPW